MRKIFTLLLFILSLPAVALAATYDILWIGNTRITDSGYWTTDGNGNLMASDAGNYNIAFDADTHTLTLNNANIAGQYDFTYNNVGAGIWAYSRSGAVSLNIQVTGNNVVSGSYGIYALSNGGEVSVTISGGGSLTASGSSNGISIVSEFSSAALAIEGTALKASGSYGDGVQVQAGESFSGSLSVNGGSLTASGRKGILFPIGSPSLNVNDSTIIRASGGIAAGINEDVTVPTEGTGIVFNGSTGTVYGNASLQEDLIIGEGESLILDNGANLDANGHNVIVDGGTLDESLAESLGGNVIYKVTKVELDKSRLTLEVGDEETLIPTITPDNATNQTVTWSSDNEQVATVENGKVTAVGAGTTTITVETKDGEFTATCEVTVSKATPTFDMWTVTDKTYDGNPIAITPPTLNGGTITEGITLSYKGKEEGDEAYTENAPTNAGNYTVKAYYAGDDSYNSATTTAEFSIIPAQASLSYSATTIEKQVGDEPFVNMLTNEANMKVAYSSTNPDVATVDDTGKVTLIAAGTTTIMATDADTNYDAAAASYVLTVNKKEIEITKPDEQKGTITLEPGSMSFTLTATISGLPESERNGTWNWVSHEPDVAKVEKLTPITTRAESDIISTAQVTPVSEGTATITVTYTSKNYTGTLTYAISVKEKEEPEPPVIPDYPDYYNIYVDECEGVTVETSTNVVREGNSMTFTVDVEEGYTGENMTVKVKRSLFGYSEIIKPNEKGIYEVKNIYTEIYITVDSVEEVEEPTGIGDVESTKVYAKDGSIYVQTPQLETVTIISISGEVRKQEELIGLQRYDLPRGIYIICIGEERIKVRN